ncbi:unnamed protein product [Urochloa humidicola]
MLLRRPRTPCAEIRQAPGDGSRERGLVLRRRTESAYSGQLAPSHKIRRRTASASSFSLRQDKGAGSANPSTRHSRGPSGGEGSKHGVCSDLRFNPVILGWQAARGHVVLADSFVTCG